MRSCARQARTPIRTPRSGGSDAAATVRRELPPQRAGRSVPGLPTGAPLPIRACPPWPLLFSQATNRPKSQTCAHGIFISSGLAKSRSTQASSIESVNRKLQAMRALRTMASREAHVHTLQAHAAAALARHELREPRMNILGRACSLPGSGDWVASVPGRVSPHARRPSPPGNHLWWTFSRPPAVKRKDDGFDGVGAPLCPERSSAPGSPERNFPRALPPWEFSPGIHSRGPGIHLLGPGAGRNVADQVAVTGCALIAIR